MSPIAYAEVDRLRSLPVVRVCGECGFWEPSVCRHPQRDLSRFPFGWGPRPREDAPPPECPLRKAAR